MYSSNAHSTTEYEYILLIETRDGRCGVLIILEIYEHFE